MRILPVNASTVLVELPGLDEVLALQASLAADPLPGLVEMLPAARTLMLRFDPARQSDGLPHETPAEAFIDTLAGTLARRDLAAVPRPVGPLVRIPVVYDGEDLAEVARLTGLTAQEVVRRHQASEFTVAFCGFAPGFAYLIGGDPVLQVPRRATPRPQVPAGAVAIGGPYCGVYPQATPGGWQLIGRTPMSMWDPVRDPPALLTPGTRVRFVEMGEGEPRCESVSRTAEPHAAGPRATERRVDAAIEVTAAMMPALVQDLGRPGHAHLGVAPAGAADRVALQAANRAVGNLPEWPCLEIALGGFAFRCLRDVVVAFAGAPVAIAVQPASGEAFDAVMEHPISLRSGDSLRIGYPSRGLRTYLALHGGIGFPRALGSASRDTLAALGPQPVVKGVRLWGSPLGTGRATPSLMPVARAAASPLPASGETVVLDVHLGPRTDWFTDEALQLLCSQPWKVTPQSSRVGLRLQGAQALARRDAAELPSEGLVRGAIQVPHDGQPMLLLADHPLTGGYPVIAVVAEHHLDLAGQIPPGATIRFRIP